MLLLFSSLFACSNAPLWALDAFTLRPSGDALSVEQRWQVFSSRALNRPESAPPLCEQQASFIATVSPPCERCEISWHLRVQEAAPPCDFSSQAFMTPTVIGLGELPSEWQNSAPYLGLSQGVWLGYNNEAPVFWGWAYPSSLDEEGRADGPSWNNQQDFTLKAAFIFEWPEPAP